MFAGVGILAIACVGILSYVLFTPHSTDMNTFRFTVKQGDTIFYIADGLADAGLISSDLFFRLGWRVEGGGIIQEGTYTIPKSVSLHTLYRMFRSGPDRTEISIRIIEGWTTQQIAEYLAETRRTHDDDFLQAVKNDWKREYPFLPGLLAGNPLEGYLFPDTYRIFEDSSNEAIIRKMLDNFSAKVTGDMRLEAKTQDLSLHEIVILASIIEREVTGKQERGMVSDIFRRRISIGMPLQADSTINYVSGKKDAQARYADLEIDSPYNTYKYRGLPPGPIANPGLESLNAALHPISNNYLYFLTSPDGKAHFSKTFDEHKEKKFKYLQQTRTR